jgi:hypothetical protein
MSIQEKKALINMFSSLLIMGSYIYYIFIFNGDESMSHVNDLQWWGKTLLIYMPVVIVSKIIIHIVFTIINKVAAKEDDPGFADEFDKLIELKSDRNGNYFFITGFISSMVFIALGYPLYVMFLSIFLGGLVSDVSSELWKFYFYRKGF